MVESGETLSGPPRDWMPMIISQTRSTPRILPVKSSSSKQYDAAPRKRSSSARPITPTDRINYVTSRQHLLVFDETCICGGQESDSPVMAVGPAGPDAQG